MKKNTEGFKCRLVSGAYAIAWRDEDIYELAKLYGLKSGEALRIAKSVMATAPKAKAFAGIITKDAAPLQTRWNFTASTGAADRVGDLVEVAGIQLADYRAAGSPWHWQHDFSRPLGRSVEIDKVGGKLVGTVEFGVGTFEPDATMAAKAVSSNMVRGVSIGFRPIKWTPMKDAQGALHFHEVDLLEISLVSVPCCQGAVIHAPAKTMQQLALEMKQLAAADRKWLEAHKRREAVERYVASTTPEQRKRERQATLYKLRGETA
jgi:HK97 family phage prohead protease